VSTLWQELCDALAEEVDRQETVFAVCQAQQQALILHDPARVQSTSESLETLTKEAREAEHRRNAVTARIVQAYGLAVDKPVLSELAAAAPEPWKSRIYFYQHRLLTVLKDVRALLRDNELRAKRSAQVVRRYLSLIQPAGISDGRYDRRGAVTVFRGLMPALLDARG